MFDARMRVVASRSQVWPGHSEGRAARATAQRAAECNLSLCVVGHDNLTSGLQWTCLGRSFAQPSIACASRVLYFCIGEHASRIWVCSKQAHRVRRESDLTFGLG